MLIMIGSAITVLGILFVMWNMKCDSTTGEEIASLISIILIIGGMLLIWAGALSPYLTDNAGKMSDPVKLTMRLTTGLMMK